MTGLAQHRAAALIARATGTVVPNKVARAGNIGDVAYLMLAVLEARQTTTTTLGDIVSTIGHQTGDLVDPAHCFNTLKLFCDPERTDPVLVKKLEKKIQSANKGKPVDAYVITKAGLAAIADKEAHLEAVLAFRKGLKKKPK